MRHIKTPELLWPALRQYRHNTDNSPNINHPENGFVTGFDYDETVVVVKRLEQQLAALRELLSLIRDDLRLRSEDGVVDLSDFIWMRMDKALQETPHD